ncbi:Lysophospholipid acyltransferase 1 [Nibea albiflora]|uniref:Lysophospholipid acyltransferase 1 n=1 Tax=Nibea albiflora TaxID=240163 RepID=A0ACB7F878_NIBAL|nr:Lysophospholipid acyltransferase 1 [Nibea albiflora]
MGERADPEFNTTGSKWLLPVSGYLGFPLDQVNFLACQLFALFAAFWFRLYLSPSHANPLVRHAVATLLGIAFLIFCFGWYSAHILTVVVASYLIIIKCDIGNVHSPGVDESTGSLTCAPRDFGDEQPGLPLMIVTQKITTLAFQLHDGMCKKPEQLTPEQRLLAINVRPSLIEYLSYNLNFLSILVGPCSNYTDYIDFIEGRHISKRLRQHSGTCNGQNGYDKTPEPSPMNAVCRKLLVCSGCMLFFLTVTRSLPITYNVDPHFVSQAPFLTRLTYAFFSIQAARPKFYFAWTLADAVNNAAGYGFLGMDENGKPSWDLICNLNILGIETATSFKTFIDNWNIRTGIWLKTVCYDRAPKHRLALTFILSALWHGVYPGYYFTFITAIPITMAARTVRKCIRHYFLGHAGLKMGYDIITWAATQLAICYTVMPFLLLAVEPTLVYYRSMYFHVHIISILAAIVLHQKHKPREPSATSKTLNSTTSSFSSPCSAQCQPVHSNNNDKVD